MSTQLFISRQRLQNNITFFFRECTDTTYHNFRCFIDSLIQRYTSPHNSDNLNILYKMGTNISIFHNPRRMDETYVYSSKDHMIQEFISKSEINAIRDEQFIEKDILELKGTDENTNN